MQFNPIKNKQTITKQMKLIKIQTEVVVVVNLFEKYRRNELF